MRAARMGLWLLLLCGCKATIPEGKLACDADSDCPDGFACVDTERGGRCYSPGAEGDAGDGDGDGDAGDGDGDAGRDAGGDGDGDAGRDAGGDGDGDAGDSGSPCEDGYRLDGDDCVDIDECEDDRGGCDAIAECENAPGTRTCVCPEHYAGDGAEEGCTPLLIELTMSGAEPEPAFESTTFAYDVVVPFLLSHVIIELNAPGDAMLESELPDGAVITDLTSLPVDLELGENLVVIRVMRGELASEYVVRIERGPEEPSVLAPAIADNGDQFGSSLALSANTLIVGAPSEDGNDGEPENNDFSDSGAAYVFTGDGLSWTEQAYLKNPDPAENDGFGANVAIDGDTAVVSAPGADIDGTAGVGAAYVYTRSGATWAFQARLTPAVSTLGDGLSAVAIDGDTIVLGAFQEDGNGTGLTGDPANGSAPESGAAYVFERSGTTWTQTAYVKASNTDAGDLFGISVAISGDTFAVGAMGERSALPADQLDNSVFDAGAVYVFVRDGAGWRQQAYVKAPNADGSQDPGSGDLFGWSLALDGDRLVVGAPGESSSAHGINGDMNDDTQSFAGAAYVFERSGETWTNVAYLKRRDAHENDEWYGSSVAIRGGQVLVAGFDSLELVAVDGGTWQHVMSRSLTPKATPWVALGDFTIALSRAVGNEATSPPGSVLLY